MSNRRFNKQTRKNFLSGGQVKLDANKDGKISGKDFALLKKKKKKNKTVKAQWQNFVQKEKQQLKENLKYIQAHMQTCMHQVYALVK